MKKYLLLTIVMISLFILWSGYLFYQTSRTYLPESCQIRLNKLVYNNGDPLRLNAQLSVLHDLKKQEIEVFVSGEIIHKSDNAVYNLDRVSYYKIDKTPRSALIYYTPMDSKTLQFDTTPDYFFDYFFSKADNKKLMRIVRVSNNAYLLKLQDGPFGICVVM